MKKVLFTSHVANFVKFNRPFIQWFREQGWEVHYASMGEEEIDCCDKVHIVPFHRSPYSLDNVRAYWQLKRIIDREQYDLIHCHTPMGGVVTRLAAIGARKRGTKVLYTAHGFHFYKGAPLANWLLYYPVEKFLSRYTDCLITINEEDYQFALRKGFCNNNPEKVKITTGGVGVDLFRFSPGLCSKKETIRAAFGLAPADFVIVVVAEFTRNKNQQMLIEALPALKAQIPALKTVFAGVGECLDDCKSQVEHLGLQSCVQFPGYYRKMEQIYAMADVLVSCSHREGFPISLAEACSMGVPVVCSNVRGQRDIIASPHLGMLFDLPSSDQMVNAILELYREPGKRELLSRNNLQRREDFSVQHALESISNIYKGFMYG